MYAYLGVCAGEGHSNVLAGLAQTYALRPRKHKAYLFILLDFWPGQQAIRLGIAHSRKIVIRDHSLAGGYAATCIGIDFLTLCEDSRRRVGKSMSRLLAACSRMCRHKPYCSEQGFTETSKEIYADACAGMQPQASS